MINFLIKALSKIKILRFFNLSTTAYLQKCKFRIPIIRGLGKDNLDISEKWMIKVLEKLLPLKGGLFIDIGVNTGQTLLKLKATDANRNYIGFEPNPNCIFYVQELIRVNEFTHTTLYPVGLADRTQLIELNFFTNDPTDAAASIVKNFRDTSTIYRKEYIPCFKFSDVNLTLNENVAIVKIDVEGAELEVLEGLADMLNRNRPFIIIEILPVYDKSNEPRLIRQQAIEHILSSLSYRILRILKKGESDIETLQLLPEIGIHANMSFCDYVLCPEEFLQEVNS